MTSPFSVLRLRPLGVLFALTMFGGTIASAADEDERRNGKSISSRDVDPAALQSAENRRLAQAKRLEAIDRLKGLLNSPNATGDTKAEMLLRLADFYFAQGRDIFFTEMEDYDKRFETCFNTDGCNTEALKADNRGSKQWQEQSIKIYENILRNYPTYGRADQATFFLGSAQSDIGQAKEGVNSFKTLIKQYPSSEYKTDALILIGEYYFDANEAFPALKAYLLATQDESHPKNGYATYKLAWCYYNVGEYDKAIESMKSVISKSMADGADKAKIQLQDEALKDLVRFFADAGQMNEAYDYFKSLGKDDLIKKTLKRLASQYYENGQFEQSIETYRRLILEDPNEVRNPDYQIEIIKAYGQLGDKGKTLEEVDRLMREYGKNSTWARANASNPNALKDAEDAIELNLRRLATDYHLEADKLAKSRHPSAADVYTLARQGYQAYLDNFPDNSNAYNVRFAYGELLYTLKDFAGAFEQYMAVVKADPNGEHSKFCAEAAIFAAEEQVKQEGGADASNVKVDIKNASKEPIPLTEWENRLVAACKQFADLYPNDKKVITAIFKSAYLLYGKYHFGRAAEQFNAVINMNPADSKAETAANLILDTFVIQENYEELRKNAKFYYDMKGLGNKKFKDEVFEIYESASFQIITEGYKKDKDDVKAADGFMTFYQEFPNSKNAALALNNASIYYFNAKRVADSVKARRILVDDPKFGPKTPYYYEQIAALGYDYQQTADYSSAAEFYERLFGLFPKEVERLKKLDDGETTSAKARTQANDALFAAAVFRNALGEWEKGIQNYNTWMATFPEDDQVAEVQLTVAKIYEDHNDLKKASDIYSAFYTKPPKGATTAQLYFARLHHGQAMEKENKDKEVAKLYAATVKQWEKDGRPEEATELVAEMMFKLAQPAMDKYLAMDFAGQGRKQINALKAKTQAYQQMSTTYTQVVETKAGEWGIASLVALGKVYEDMAKAWRESERPAEVVNNPEALQFFNMGIEDKAFVQDEKAVNVYKLAVESSFRLTLYNDNTAFANKRLGELRPKEYPGLQERLQKGQYTSKAQGREFNYENELE